MVFIWTDLTKKDLIPNFFFLIGAYYNPQSRRPRGDDYGCHYPRPSTSSTSSTSYSSYPAAHPPGVRSYPALQQQQQQQQQHGEEEDVLFSRRRRRRRRRRMSPEEEDLLFSRGGCGGDAGIALEGARSSGGSVSTSSPMQLSLLSLSLSFTVIFSDLASTR